MQLPSLELAEYLDFRGVGEWAGVSEWAIYAEQIPDEPDDVIVLRDIGGFMIGNLCRVSLIERVEFQVVVRANSYTEAYTKSIEVAEELEGILKETLPIDDSPYYHVVYRNGTPINVGRDAKNRAILSQNYVAVRSAFVHS